MANGQTPQQLTQNELAFLKAKVDRVILLLDASVMPPEVKTAWLTLLPHMTLEQVDRLIALTEEEVELAFKAAKKHPEDEEFILKLKAAKNRYEAKVAEADKHALAQLQKINDALAQYAS
ncbi:hypothetical protein HYW17_04345 [Candidatus Uhrbacteria bacterium]|nr:hypothetical protein [Candidatus Uhrbacteria bacterium]